MPVVDFSELHKNASERGFGLAVVNVNNLPVARGVIATAAELDAPVVLSVGGSTLSDGLMPALEVLARQAPNPLSLQATAVRTVEEAILAIRWGCNALALADGLNDDVGSEIRSMASACGIPVSGQEEQSRPLVAIDEELASVTLGAIGPGLSSWLEIDASVMQAAAGHMQGVFAKLGASGQGRAVLGACKRWRPVEHLILYNTTTDETAAAELAAEGRRVLDGLPGVRATWSGRSVKADASYRWCWLIRFAHPAVIDYYREHPDHVAYADDHFRPVAGERISIDYELIGADEGS